MVTLEFAFCSQLSSVSFSLANERNENDLLDGLYSYDNWSPTISWRFGGMREFKIFGFVYIFYADIVEENTKGFMTEIIVCDTMIISLRTWKGTIRFRWKQQESPMNNKSFTNKSLF